MAVLLRELMRQIDELAPLRYAEEWDNVGLQVGSPDAQIRRVLVAVDATGQVVEEAARKNADMLVAHHPVLFGQVSSVRSDRWPGCVVTALVECGCGLYVAHTNLDVAPRTNSSSALARALGLHALRPLALRMPAEMAAISAWVEGGADERLAAELARTGSTIRITDRAADRGLAEGWMVEVTCARERTAQTLDALCRTEDLSVRVLEVRPVLGRPPFPGLGVIGEREPTTSAGLAGAVGLALGSRAVRVSSTRNNGIAKVAVVAGSAKGLLASATQSGADALVAGEVGHHLAIEASENGIATIEVGHFASERPAMANLAGLLREVLGDRLDVVISADERDPFAEQRDERRIFR